MRRYETPDWLIYISFAGIIWPVTDMFGWKALILCLSIMVFWYTSQETLGAILNQNLGRLDNNQLAIWREQPPWLPDLTPTFNSIKKLNAIDERMSDLQGRMDEIAEISRRMNDLVNKMDDIQFVFETKLLDIRSDLTNIENQLR